MTPAPNRGSTPKRMPSSNRWAASAADLLLTPVVVFVPVSPLFGLVPAIIAALSVAALILVGGPARVRPTGDLRLHRRGDLRADRLRRGRVQGLLPAGHLVSLFWASVFAVSLIRRPVVGYIWGWVNGHDRGWRRVRRAAGLRHRDRSWVLVFSSRFVVQQHLYDADQPAAGRRPHRDGVAADRGGRAGDLSGSSRPEGGARA